jgi:hypothetical protein
MATENPSLRLGDLLTSAGLLKPTDLREAMMIARQQQLPVGRVLIMNGYLSEGQLQSAVQAQSMVKDSIIDLDTAVEALDLVATEHITLDESLIRMGWTINTQVITNKLGEFLVEAELVAPADIHYALEQCREIGLPLGRVLVVTGYLTEEMLTNSLNAQVLVRDGRLSREQAVHGLRAALERQITLEESLQQTGIVHAPNATRMRLGELLLGAGLIDEASLMNAVEIGLVSEKLIGQVLLEKGSLSPEGLDNALVLQNMVAQGELYAQDAINALRKSIQSQISAMDALNSLHEPAPAPVSLAEPLGLYQFLQLGGLITPQDVEQAMHTSARDTNLMGQMLLFAGIMPGYMVDASKEALELINRGALTIEQGMIALKACFSSGSTLQDAFRELNWEFQQGAPIQAHTEVAPQDNFTPAISQSQSGGYTAGNQPAPSQAVPEPQYQSGQQPATNVPQAQQSQSNSQPVVQQAMQQQPMQQQTYAQQNASGAQPTLAPAPAPQQSQWTQSQSGAQQNPPQSSAPVADAPITAPPLPLQIQPVITVLRVDQAVNPWAAKTQSPAISSVSSAPNQNVQPNQNAPAQPYQQPAPPESVVQPMPEVQTAPPPPVPAPPVPPEAPHPVTTAPAEEEAAPPKRKRLNDLMPKSKK